MTASTVEDVLTKTIDLLGQEGFWIKGDLYRFDPGDDVPTGACLMGCMEIAAGRSTLNWVTACDRVEAALGSDTIVDFNDDAFTTKEDMILLVKKALHNENQLEKVDFE